MDAGAQRLNVALRLKAARYLAGRISAKGRGVEAAQIPVAELVQRPVLAENGISKNRVEDYEQMKVATLAPMELERIADALGVPRDFLLEPLRDGAQPAGELERIERRLKQIEENQREFIARLDIVLDGDVLNRLTRFADLSVRRAPNAPEGGPPPEQRRSTG